MAIYLDYIHQKYNANTALKEETNMFEITSVAYDEYLNRRNMLENCTDNTIKPILEAQVEVLHEVSFKDIIGKIKTKIQEIFAWIKEKFDQVIDFFKKLLGIKVDNKTVKQAASEVDEEIKNMSKEQRESLLLSKFEFYENNRGGDFHKQLQIDLLPRLVYLKGDGKDNMSIQRQASEEDKIRKNAQEYLAKCEELDKTIEDTKKHGFESVHYVQSILSLYVNGNFDISGEIHKEWEKAYREEKEYIKYLSYWENIDQDDKVRKDHNTFHQTIQFLNFDISNIRKLGGIMYNIFSNMFKMDKHNADVIILLYNKYCKVNEGDKHNKDVENLYKNATEFKK